MNIFKITVAIITVGFFSLAQVPIAVISFEGNGVTVDETKALTDRFRNEMFKFSNYDMMERSFMEEILDEQGFQLSGCTSDACVVEVGKLIGVEQMIGGSISKVGNIFSVSVRIMSVETGQIVKTATYDHVGDIGSLLTTGMYKIAEKLAGEEASQKGAVAAGVGSFYIISEPAGANIWIDDNLVEGVTPKVVENIQAGSHKISLQKDNYTAETIAELAPADIQMVSLNLSIASGKIQILVKPYATEVLLDGKSQGYSPFMLSNIPAGHHRIRFKHDHYKAIEKEITIEANRTVKMEDELERLAALEISSVPSNIDASINNEKYSTPLNRELAAGEYQLRFMMPDFFTQKQTLVLMPGEQKQLHIKLLPDVSSIKNQIQTFNRKRNIWLGSAVASVALGAYLSYSADKHYEKYKTPGSNATALHKKIEIEDAIFPVAYSIAGISIVPVISNIIKISSLTDKLKYTYKPNTGQHQIELITFMSGKAHR